MANDRPTDQPTEPRRRDRSRSPAPVAPRGATWKDQQITLPIGAIGMLVAGLLGGGSGSFLFGGGNEDMVALTSTHEREVATLRSTDAKLLAELEELKDENRDLRVEIATLRVISQQTYDIVDRAYGQPK